MVSHNKSPHVVILVIILVVNNHNQFKYLYLSILLEGKKTCSFFGLSVKTVHHNIMLDAPHSVLPMEHPL